MPSLHVRISCRLQNASPVEAERTVTIDQAKLDHLFPYIPPGEGRGVPRTHQAEAEEIISSIVKEEFFPDEVTPVENSDDLRGLGVTSLKFSFQHGNAHLSGTLIP